MKNIYTIYNSKNQQIGQTPIMRQAEHAALGYAKQHNAPFYVERANTTGNVRRVQFNPDGTLVLLWKGGEVRKGIQI